VTEFSDVCCERDRALDTLALVATIHNWESETIRSVEALKPAIDRWALRETGRASSATGYLLIEASRFLLLLRGVRERR
jgi:hypothetical protein